MKEGYFSIILYGYIFLRYQYEPWHLRYVGKKAAKVMFERQITLEEYFQIVRKM
ncbi:hypothetical protein HNR78_002345 [Parageobacillus toebii NBRC 107807]|jgi:hypothetical protein|uniref:Uncharacterized protein n=1 Tax=Parageobacillus toebii NBRC 107807 TaxID=1223503 RepID=A0AA89P452_9BACL|nr:hypothetical protein [Parageobacillus toebii NBRC 107807]